MHRQLVLKIEPWAVAVALILVALVGYLAFQSTQSSNKTVVASSKESDLPIGAATEQLKLAITQAQTASEAPTVEEAHRLIRQTINILEGADGPEYDAQAGNPGDGYGARVYVSDMAERVHDREDLLPAQLREQVERSLAITQQRLEHALALLKQALGRSTGQEASALLAAALPVLTQVLGDDSEAADDVGLHYLKRVLTPYFQ